MHYGSFQSLPDSNVTLNFNDAPGDVLFNKAGNLLVDTRINSGIVVTYQVDSIVIEITGRLDNN